jgi:glycosyltransferase involved in cell wall biosynthesis
MKHILLLTLFVASLLGAADKRIVVVIPSYNNKEWYQWNLDSVFAQEYPHWRIIYTDDCSSDGTGDLVEAYIREHGFEGRVTLIKNTTRRRALENLYTMIHSCDDDEIVVVLDGDDALVSPNVLQCINLLYRVKNIWLTYGQFREWPTRKIGFCKAYDREVIDSGTFRQVIDGPSHLRTFYAGLFKKIKKEDLMKDGAFFEMTYDLAIMFPMLEMARERHFFVTHVLVLYNVENQINDHKVDQEKQAALAEYIRQKAAYGRLERLFLSV